MVTSGGKCTPESAQALEELCRIYWYPLYAYVRRRGYSREDAEEVARTLTNPAMVDEELQALLAAFA